MNGILLNQTGITSKLSTKVDKVTTASTDAEILMEATIKAVTGQNIDLSEQIIDGGSITGR